MRRYWEDPANYPIDPNRIDLAREFRDDIRGPHGEELRYILHRMRATPVKGKICTGNRGTIQEVADRPNS